AGALAPATPHSSLTAANPVTGIAKPGYRHPGFTRSERPQVTAGERHGIAASSRMRGLVVPRDARIALSIERLRRVNGPKGGDGIVAGVHGSDELVHCVCRLQLRIRARMSAREGAVARGVRASQSNGQVV